MSTAELATDERTEPLDLLRRRDGRERGAVLIEFAIVFPLLVILIMGMFSGGIAHNQKLQVTHATREGARYAASLSASQTFTTGTWAQNVRNLVIERADGDLSGPGATVCVALVEGSPAKVVTGPGSVTSYATTGAGATSSTPCDPTETYSVTANDLGRRVQVVVSRPGSIDPAILPSINFTMTSRATAKSESSL